MERESRKKYQQLLILCLELGTSPTNIDCISKRQESYGSGSEFFNLIQIWMRISRTAEGKIENRGTVLIPIILYND